MKGRVWHAAARIGHGLAIAHALFGASFAVSTLGFSYADMLYYKSAPLSHRKAWKDAAYAGLLWPVMGYIALRYGDANVYISVYSTKPTL